MSGFSVRLLTGAVLLTIASATPLLAQTVPLPARTIELSGPRFGLTVLDEGVVQRLRDKDIDVHRAISQFGWQFEKQFFHSRSQVAAVTELIGLLGGLDQGAVIPSLSLMVGLRSRGGAEFGVGPNITPAGTALVLAAGHTFRAGVINVPVNLAVVPSGGGIRVTVLTGFSLR